MNIDTGRDRKRTANLQRSEVIRERIEDYLMRSGGKHSRERYLALRKDFVQAAVRTAERAGLRVWKGDDHHRVKYNAEHSLATLFGEVTVNSRKPGGGGTVPRTGVNAAWVLDIWEATLDHINREDHLTREQERQEEIDRGVRDEPIFDEPDEGVKVFQIAKTAPISLRLLEAYLNRDDDGIMRIAVELEHVENGH